MELALIVNRSEKRKSKFRKKAENGDILSWENYIECCMFGITAQPRLSIMPQTDAGHDLNLGELRDLLLVLMGLKVNLPSKLRLRNGPFVRRVVHLHVANCPPVAAHLSTLSTFSTSTSVSASVSFASLTSGGAPPAQQLLSMLLPALAQAKGIEKGNEKGTGSGTGNGKEGGDGNGNGKEGVWQVKEGNGKGRKGKGGQGQGQMHEQGQEEECARVLCVRVDREVEESGTLPYKLLTVSYSKLPELMAAEGGGSVGAAVVEAEVGAVGTAQDKEEVNRGTGETVGEGRDGRDRDDEVRQRLLPYVLSPALLRLWGYPEMPEGPQQQLLSNNHHHQQQQQQQQYNNNQREHQGQGDECTAEDSSEPASKRPRVDTSITAATTSATTATTALTTNSNTTTTTTTPIGVLYGSVPNPAEAEQFLGMVSPEAEAEVMFSTLVNTHYKRLWGEVGGGMGTEGMGMGACAGTAVAVAAVDCEMCDTAAGLELTRVSLLAADNSLLLDTYVKPSMPITDYRTQYSGINPHTLQHVTVTLRMVQLALLRLISADTVLVGHSLNSDLRALKISHSRCLDTSLLYPHPRGYPLRLKLKQLALDYLNQRIQRNEGIGAAGHDSTEDARAALQLALLKAEKGPSFGIKQADQRTSLLGLLPHCTQSLLVWPTGDGDGGGVKDRGATGGGVGAGMGAGVGAGVGGNEDGPTFPVISGQTPTQTQTQKKQSFLRESCVGGNVQLLSPNPDTTSVVAEMCSFLGKGGEYGVRVTERGGQGVGVGQGGQGQVQGQTQGQTQEPGIGAVSSWVPVPVGGGGCKEVCVSKASYCMGVLDFKDAGTEGGAGTGAGTGAAEEGGLQSMAASLAEAVGQLRTATEIGRSMRGGGVAGGVGGGTTGDAGAVGVPSDTLLIITTQASLEPVIELLRIRRVRSKGGALMWGAEQELQLKGMRKNNLAYMVHGWL